MTDKGYFAQRLRELRDEAGISQKQLAELSGLGVSTVRHFEYGLREPTFETLCKLARALGVTLAAFDPGEAPPPPEPEPPKPRVRPRKEK